MVTETRPMTQYVRAKSKEEVQSLVQELERRAATKRDYIVASKDIDMQIIETVNGTEATVSLDMGQPLGVVQYGLTPLAHTQLATKLRIPTAYYDRMLEEGQLDLLQHNVRTWLRREPSKKRLARTLDGRLRAWLSSRFRTLDDVDLFFHSYQVATKVGAEIQSADLNDRRFYMRFLHPDWRETIESSGRTTHSGDHRRNGGEGDVVIPGVVVSNSEVGFGKLNVQPFIFRLACRNGMVVDDGLFQVHLGRDKSIGLLSEQTTQLEDQLLWSKVSDLIEGTFDRERFAALIAELNGAASEQLVAPIEAVDAVVKQYSMSDADRQSILNELTSPSTDIDPGRTIWGLVNAVTQLANTQENPEDAHLYQEIGGNLLRSHDFVAVRR